MATQPAKEKFEALEEDDEFEEFEDGKGKRCFCLLSHTVRLGSR